MEQRHTWQATSCGLIWVVRVREMSFLDFLDALVAHPKRLDVHAAPQYFEALDAESYVVFLPIETFKDGILEAFARLQPRVQPPLVEGLNHSHQYVYKAPPQPVGVSRVPWKKLSAAHNHGNFPSYDQFYLDPAVKNKALCLFARDVELYRRACAQDWIGRLCPACAAGCAAQVARFQ